MSKGHFQKLNWQIAQDRKEFCDLERVLEVVGILS